MYVLICIYLFNYLTHPKNVYISSVKKILFYPKQLIKLTFTCLECLRAAADKK